MNELHINDSHEFYEYHCTSIENFKKPLSIPAIPIAHISTEIGKSTINLKITINVGGSKYYNWNWIKYNCWSWDSLSSPMQSKVSNNDNKINVLDIVLWWEGSLPSAWQSGCLSVFVDQIRKIVITVFGRLWYNIITV